MRTVETPAERLPLIGEYDVAVAGAGPAGVAAAVAAAREGAQALLVDPLAFPGGTATGALLWGFMGFPTGRLLDETFHRLDGIGGIEGRLSKGTRYDVELLKAVYLEMLRDAGVARRFHTWVEKPWMEDGRLAGLVLCGRGGRTVARAKAVVDATGDAAVAAGAGAACEKGDPEDGHMQHVSFRWEVVGTPLSRYETHDLSERSLGKLGASPGFSWQEIQRRAAEARERGEIVVPEGQIDPHADTFPFRHNGTMAVGQFSLFGVDATDADRVNRAMEDGLLAAKSVLAFCRKHLPGFENARFAKAPGLLGIRETRRAMGRYVLTSDDVREGRKFPDAVARCANSMGLHDAPYHPRLEDKTPEYKKGLSIQSSKWFEIPYRALIPREVSGLLTAGRCISTDRLANGAIRLMATCSCTGEAAGVAAAMAVALQKSPGSLDGCEVRKRLIKLGCELQ